MDLRQSVPLVSAVFIRVCECMCVQVYNIINKALSLDRSVNCYYI